MRTLGFDLGCKTGYAVTEDGVLRTSGAFNLGAVDQIRYGTFAKYLRSIMQLWEPEIIGYEMVWHTTGTSGLVIHGCRGIVEAESNLAGILCVPVNVMTAKKTVTGTGKATKDEMKSVITSLYGPFDHAPTEDEIDTISNRVGRELDPWLDPRWGLEEIVAHLAGFPLRDVTPFA